MTKQNFIEKLKKELKDESYETVCQAINYYEEMIDDLMEDGYREEEAILKLGNVKDILKNMKAQEVVEISKMKKSTVVTITILLILGFPLWGSLLAAAACLVLSFYILIWCIPILTVALGIGGFLSFVVGILGSFILFGDSVSLGLTQLGITALLGALSIIGFYLTYLVSGRILHFTKKINRKIKNWLFNIFRKVGIIC